MVFNSKKLCIRAFLLMLLANLLLYASYHLYYLFEGAVWLAFAHQYLSEIADFTIPAVCAILAITVYSHRGIPSAVGASALIFSSRAVYYFLFHYVELVAFNQTPVSSTDALIISLLYTVILYAVGLLHALALFGIGALVYKFVKRKSLASGKARLRASLAEDLTVHTAFDLASPISKLVFAVSFCQFLFHVGFEIFDTVSFFSSYGTSYTTGELIYILWRYVFFIILFAACHALCSFIKNKIFESGNFAKKEDPSSAA